MVDTRRGPILSEATFLANMKEGPGYFSKWANHAASALWQGVDGGVPPADIALPHTPRRAIMDALPQCASILLSRVQQEPAPWLRNVTSLHDLISSEDGPRGRDRQQAANRPGSGLSCPINLASWGIDHGERVALLLPSGFVMAETLLAVMNGYCAVPFSPDTPADALAISLRATSCRCVLSIRGSAGAQAAASAASAIGCLALELLPLSRQSTAFGLMPSTDATRFQVASSTCRYRSNGLDDKVLLLQTSGTTAHSKEVVYSLRKVLASGMALARSMELGSEDVGINMMPLHHVGGIMCNIIAPLVTSGRMLYASDQSSMQS